MRMIAPRTGAPEVTLAEEQEDLKPLTVAVYGDNDDLGPRTMLARFRPTEEEREALAEGEDIYVAVVTFGKPMQPIDVQVGPEGWSE